ncbi:hypothetical protein NA57DRAFT_30059 [Rhizodiscina lignyota]|uniref:SacI domain-containing protein n=1 Tax=Rhizodiscina lignyota TaxID=1504668 RepID=A0A9P4ISQ1_9PEZI|nr:hypothetical protein NA57DRAFT_30059 [Rhizodiscina lignyota]
MPGLVRKILIFAAVDGLVLQPAPPRNHRPATEQAIKIAYRTDAIAPLLKDRRDEETAPPAFESHGIVGLLKISSVSYLISISDRKQVAQIRGNPIYVVNDVALIPLSSQPEAEKALAQARDARARRLKARGDEAAELSESSDEEDTKTLTDNDSLPETPPGEDSDRHHTRSTSVAEDVINKKGMYGRFADRWFSRKGWSAEGRRKQGMSSEENLNTQAARSNVEALGTDSRDAAATSDTQSQGDGTKADKDDDAASIAQKHAEDAESKVTALLPRILRTAKLFFASQSFFFSYDLDLSRSLPLQHRSGQGQNVHNSFDPLFFWNGHLLKPFTDAGQQTFTMPLIQGFVGQRAFALDTSESSRRGSIVETKSNPEDVVELQGAQGDEEESAKAPPAPKAGQKQFLLTVISRRSIKRAGLRYLRRGVDEEGNVANSVETEQILSTPSWGENGDRIYSFLQYRGSIPLFFSQSPYSFKPLPVFYGSEATNAIAFKLHFQKLLRRYGDIQAASLVDKRGTEMSIGEAFENHAKKLNESGGIDGKGQKLDFEWFDFHHACRGMKFENVSMLMDTLRPGLESNGWTLERNGELEKIQRGILRTNCMDCLDRTNVVQSATARDALEQQLKEQGFEIDLQRDPTTAWFNTLWADNGDAISRQYAGTAALKGDFTRTRKRNISGALTDFGLTLNRYYNNIVNDYLAQTFIDFALGNADESIFEEFEADMKSQDYAVDLRKVRQNAIDTCTKIVFEDPNEDMIAGWTLSCPRVSNTLRSLPFEECVLLLSETALYFCRFDWGTEKVREFERVELEHLEAIMRGTYVTSTLAKRDTEEDKNVGLVIRYKTGGQDMRRVNTRSLASDKDGEDEKEQGEQQKAEPQAKTSDSSTKILAFKALPPRSSFASVDGQDVREMTEQEMVKTICDEITRVVNKARNSGELPTTKNVDVEEHDIISLADAKKSTGYFEQIGYSLKKLVWA